MVDILSHSVWKQNIGSPCCDQFLVLVMPLKYFIWMIQQITTVCFLFKSCCSKEYKNTKKDTFNLVTFHMLQLPLMKDSSRYCACKLQLWWIIHWVYVCFCGGHHIFSFTQSKAVFAVKVERFNLWRLCHSSQCKCKFSPWLRKLKDSICSFGLTARSLKQVCKGHELCGFGFPTVTKSAVKSSGLPRSSCLSFQNGRIGE